MTRHRVPEDGKLVDDGDDARGLIPGERIAGRVVGKVQEKDDLFLPGAGAKRSLEAVRVEPSALGIEREGFHDRFPPRLEDQGIVVPVQVGEHEGVPVPGKKISKGGNARSQPGHDEGKGERSVADIRVLLDDLLLPDLPQLLHTLRRRIREDLVGVELRDEGADCRKEDGLAVPRGHPDRGVCHRGVLLGLRGLGDDPLGEVDAPSQVREKRSSHAAVQDGVHLLRQRVHEPVYTDADR